MDIQVAVIRFGRAAQYVFGQFGLIDWLARLFEQRFKKTAFRQCQRNFFLIDFNVAALRIKDQIADGHHVGYIDAGRRCGTAQNGANARRQFARIAGFGKIIVGTKLQTENAIQRFAARGQHQYRQGWVVPPQCFQQFEAAAVGQHHIKHHAIGHMLL